MNSNHFELGGTLFLATSIRVGTPENYKQTDFYKKVEVETMMHCKSTSIYKPNIVLFCSMHPLNIFK
jgi:hypothetical protein